MMGIGKGCGLLEMGKCRGQHWKWARLSHCTGAMLGWRPATLSISIEYLI